MSIRKKYESAIDLTAKLFDLNPRQAAEKLIHDFGLDPDKPPLSGGQKQRVAIARALMRHPKILLADEPAASLDPVTGHQILELLKEIQETEGVTILMNSHNLELSLEFSDRIIGLKDGSVAFDGKPEQLDETMIHCIYEKDA